AIGPVHFHIVVSLAIPDIAAPVVFPPSDFKTAAVGLHTRPRTLLRFSRTALAWLSMMAKTCAWLWRFSPTEIIARRTIWSVTGSLSAVVALPAMTRA